ncbi:hypothetical protein GCK72_007213 [Caenorhabditis remanei]|uniref:7TM GPCR serpentine receptor class x (Srx) domain-containing protein n=1 Tax=Caenorhabditis remanei TaxID=31234 RepID=A0A6A5HKX7_CAERE|nr:hypothetical protein GCK72_007213 [Caenorhabditis remanei]KAF1767254.1 hypothetical protein GCK72_007213 [Caenorhabditis remanei]
MSLIDEFLYSKFSTPNVRIVSGVMLILVCLTGSIINSLNFIAIIFRVNKRDGFLKICGLSSFGNAIVCIGYLCFPVPVMFIQSEPNHWLNAVMGQLIGWFAWSIAPLSQILLAINRITAVFFPHLHMKSYKYSPTNVYLKYHVFLNHLKHQKKAQRQSTIHIFASRIQGFV